MQMPSSERFGLTAQMRRAAVSVSSNLAEGCGRRRDTELGRFVQISQGSLSELECQALLAHELDFMRDTDVSQILSEIHAVRGMLAQLRRSLQIRPRP
jgi:four helix bundle protein